MEQEKIKEIIDLDCVLDVHELIQNSEKQHTKAVNEFNEVLFTYTKQVDGKIILRWTRTRAYTEFGETTH